MQCYGKVGIYIVLWLRCICIPVGQAFPCSQDAGSAWIMLASPNIRDALESPWALTARGGRTLTFCSAGITLYKPALPTQISAWNGSTRGQVLRSTRTLILIQGNTNTSTGEWELFSLCAQVSTRQPSEEQNKWKCFLRLINHWFEHAALL